MTTQSAGLTFVTGNNDKFITALHVCQQFGITLDQASPHIDEVQAEDSEYIARKKAESAFELLRMPVIISDDSWALSGLRGFPGPYMKSMNHWLTADDFLRLTVPLKDRSCVLSQILVYQDASEQVLFMNQLRAEILTSPRGDTDIPWTALVVLEGDNGKTIAEIRATQHDRSGRIAADIWRQLLKWYLDHRQIEVSGVSNA